MGLSFDFYVHFWSWGGHYVGTDDFISLRGRRAKKLAKMHAFDFFEPLQLLNDSSMGLGRLHILA